MALSTGSRDRKFFDKCMRDGNATFNTADAMRFLAHMPNYDDRMQLLYRLLDPKVRAHPCVLFPCACTQPCPARARMLQHALKLMAATTCERVPCCLIGLPDWRAAGGLIRATHAALPMAPARPPACLLAQEHGLKRLKAALCCDASASYMRDYVMPFLAVLGDDMLGLGTCRWVHSSVQLCVAPPHPDGRMDGPCA